MNSFNLYLNDSEIKGVVFPFRFAELLDERLDEAYVDFYNRVEFYEPLTEAKIEIYQDNKLADTLYFVVGNDNSTEYPAGSGIYKHSVYLIERTKLLDGIVCSSLTFTNSKINPPIDTSIKRCFEDMSNSSNMAGKFPLAAIEELTAPILWCKNEDLILPSVDDVFASFKAHSGLYELKYTETYTLSVNIYDSRCVIDHDENNTYKGNSPVKINTEKDKISVDYLVGYQHKDYGTMTATRGYFWISTKIKFIQKAALPLKKWTITDCINRVLECAKPLFGSEAPEYKLNDTQATQYDKILAPEFSMTQCTLREQLKVIGSFIHAEPWLDEYNTIHFKSLGTTPKCSLQGKPYVYSGAKTDINQYCTEVRTTATNIISSMSSIGKMVDPANNYFQSLRTETINTRLTIENGIIITQKPIYSIEKVICRLRDDSYKVVIDSVDITPFVYEETTYKTQLSNYEEEAFESKSCALYYTQGSNNIKGLFYQSPHNKNTAKYSKYAICNILGFVNKEGLDAQTIYNALVDKIHNLEFRVVYKPIYSSLVSHGKNHYESGKREYTQIYNQTENIVESQYFGENLKGIAARLGNPEKERTYILKNFSDIPETGQMLYDYTEDGQMLDGYAISAVTAEIMPHHIKCTVGLSKDFNRISEYVGISSIKRMYEVSERQVYNRNILIKEYLIVGEYREYNKKTLLLHKTKAFSQIFSGSTADEEDVGIVDSARVAEVKKDLTIGNVVILPVHCSVFGNTLGFSFSFKDNYSAGQRVEYAQTEDGITGYWSKDVPYSDYYGRIYYFDFAIGKVKDSDAQNRNNLPWIIPEAGFSSGDYFPVTENYISHYLYRIRKDSRERISVTYELEAQSNDPNIIIGSEFMRLCRLVNDKTPESLRLYILNSEDASKISKFDSTLHFEPSTKTDDFYNFQQKWVTEVDNTKFSIAPTTTDEEGKEIAIQNRNNGWIIATGPTTNSFDALDEDGNTITQTTHHYGKILILCTAKNEASIKLDFFLTRK